MDRAMRRRSLAGVVGLTMLLVTLAVVVTARGSAATGRARSAKPTIVLVHGAWANTASWSGVIARLEAEGYTADAPPNPLHSLNGDAATIADFLHTIKGPIVLVGHSYGGAVITNAATGNPRSRRRSPRRHPGARRLQRADRPLGHPGVEDHSELVRARHDRPSDPASHPAVHGPASPRTHHKSACRAPIDDR